MLALSDTPKILPRYNNKIIRRLTMKKYVRLIAMLLALVTLMGVAVSCANTNGGEETTAPAGE